MLPNSWDRFLNRCKEYLRVFKLLHWHYFTNPEATILHKISIFQPGKLNQDWDLILVPTSHAFVTNEKMNIESYSFSYFLPCVSSSLNFKRIFKNEI